MSDLQTLIDEFLGLHWAYHPIDATFAGAPGFDDVLPPADAGAAARERAALQRLGERLERMVVPNDAASRLDAKLMRAQIAAAQAALGERPRFANPVWYTGEVAFGLISLLLAPSSASEPRAFVARLAAVPDFLAAASTQLSAAAVPADWVRRARLECAAIERLLAHGLPQHPYAQGVPLATVSAARAALQRFYASLASIPDADPACGTAYLALLVREVHGLAHTPESLEREAAAAYGEALAALYDFAARLDNNRNWREQLAALAEIGPAGNDVLPTYRAWHERAMHDAYALVSPAREYALEFAYLPDWARPVASDLYFLFYRSPAPYAARSASTYWVAPPGGLTRRGPAPAQHRGDQTNPCGASRQHRSSHAERPRVQRTLAARARRGDRLRRGHHVPGSGDDGRRLGLLRRRSARRNLRLLQRCRTLTARLLRTAQHCMLPRGHPATYGNLDAR